MSNYRACLKEVLKHEGGYVHHPKDPGGETNFGVTKRVYDAYRARKNLPARSVKTIAQSEVEDIYFKQYWLPCGGDGLPPGIDLMTFDFAVNSGPSRAIRHLQAALGVAVDGRAGEITKAAAKQAYERDQERLVIAKVGQSRMVFLKGLKTWSTFGKGWKRRVDDVVVVAQRMEVTEDVQKSWRKGTVTPGEPDIYRPDKDESPEPVQDIEGKINKGALGGIVAAIAAFWNQIQEMFLGLDLGEYAPKIMLALFLCAVGYGGYQWYRAWVKTRNVQKVETPELERREGM